MCLINLYIISKVIIEVTLAFNSFNFISLLLVYQMFSSLQINEAKTELEIDYTI